MNERKDIWIIDMPRNTLAERRKKKRVEAHKCVTVKEDKEIEIDSR